MLYPDLKVEFVTNLHLKSEFEYDTNAFITNPSLFQKISILVGAAASFETVAHARPFQCFIF